jgi:hypothetical protein
MPHDSHPDPIISPEAEKGVEDGKKLPRKFSSLAESVGQIICVMSHLLINLFKGPKFLSA